MNSIIEILDNSYNPYRFGFNGKENDNEINGWQDYGERMYNRLIGRFPTADPLIIKGKKYPELSPYQFASLTPIQAIDLDGKEKYIVNLYYEDQRLLGWKVILNNNQRNMPVNNPSLGTNYTLYNVFTNGNVSIKEFPENSFDQSISYSVGNWSGVIPQQQHIDELNSGMRSYVHAGQVPNIDNIVLNNFFKTDRDEIIPDDLTEGEVGIAKLDNLAQYLIANNINIDIVGHTDNVPSNKYPNGNKDLSFFRAKHVADYLKYKGTNNQQIRSVDGKGETQPINFHSSPTEDPVNRRVEITPTAQ